MDELPSAPSFKPMARVSSLCADSSAHDDPMLGEGAVTLMIVDATRDSQTALAELFRSNGYKVRIADTGSAAIGLANQYPRPSLILLDTGMDGKQIFGRLRKSKVTREIPVIFITPGDETDIGDHVSGPVNVDFIERPLKPRVVLARVRNNLLVYRAQRLLRCSDQSPASVDCAGVHESPVIQDLRTRALAHIVDARDRETVKHVRRTQSYVRFIAACLSKTDRYSRCLSSEIIAAMTGAAALHDIGKAAIPDHILFKPGPLSSGERAVMEAHTLHGYEAISMAERHAFAAPTLLRQIKEIVRSHHECWDGSGYPDGLSGESIPLSARIVAVADVFDALIEKRVYKSSMTLSEARRVISCERGIKFDPYIVDVLMSNWNAFERIAVGEF